MKLRNFAFKLFGDTYQVIASSAPPCDFGLPAPSEPLLRSFALSEAIESGQANIFRALNWDHGLVETLYGRAKDIDAIRTWANDKNNSVSIRLVTGPGGAGKTALAASVARQLKSEGWTAGFIPRHTETCHYEAGENGLFLILDYPEERMALTKALLAKIGELEQTEFPIRLLLVSRRDHAAWEATADHAAGRFGLHAIVECSSLSVGDATQLIKEAALRFANALGQQVPKLEGAADWLAQSPAHSMPLFSAAAAVHAVLEPESAFGLSHQQVMRDLARRERMRVRAVSNGLGLTDRSLERLLALAVLGDGLTEQAVVKLQDAGAAGPANLDLAEVLSETPWWEAGRLRPPQPDKLAAAFMDLSLFPSSFPEGRSELPTWLFLSIQERAVGFGDRLSRILFDVLSLRQEVVNEYPLVKRLVEMLHRDAVDPESFVDAALHEATPWSASFAAEAAICLARSTTDKARVALALGAASGHLSKIGRRDEAVGTCEQSVQLYRELLNSDPDRFRPELAGALVNLSSLLSDVGRRDHALSTSTEGVEILRQLEEVSPGKFLPDLALALNNVANSHTALGNRKEAQASCEESVNIYRRLAAALPEHFTRDLALALNNLSSHLSADGRAEDALATSFEATEIRRSLAASRPEAYRDNLASALGTQAVHLAVLGRWTDCLAISNESVSILRELAAAQPEAFQPELATAMCNLSIALASMGQLENAVATSHEAVSLLRRPAKIWPNSYEPYLCSALANLSNQLGKLGKLEEALSHIDEAVVICKELLNKWPESTYPCLADLLHNRSNRLNNLGRREEALASSKEATEIYRNLVKEWPAAYKSSLATSINSEAGLLRRLNRKEEALVLSEEALDIYRELAAKQPEVHLPSMTNALNNLASVLSNLNREKEAIEYCQEAVAIRRDLVRAHSDRYLPALALALHNLSAHFREVRSCQEALVACDEALAIRRELARGRPDAYCRELASTLRSRGKLMLVMEDRQEAQKCFEEALEVLGPHFLRLPTAYAGLIVGIWSEYQESLTNGASRLDGKFLAVITEKLVEIGQIRFLFSVDEEG